MLETIQNFINTTGISRLFTEVDGTPLPADFWWKTLVMWGIAFVLIYLAIAKKFEPLLLLPIAIGMLLANLPGANLIHTEFFFDEHYIAQGLIADGEHAPMAMMLKEVFNNGGLIDILYLGVKLGIYPSLIFMGVGAMTDFTALIANPKSLLMGAGSQLGVFVAFFGALLLGFSPMEAGSIGIIGGADGPTAILVTKTLAPQLLGAIAIAAYSYMALIPIIQPPL